MIRLSRDDLLRLHKKHGDNTALFVPDSELPKSNSTAAATAKFDDTPIVYSDLLYKDEDVLVDGVPERKYTTQVRFNRETVAELDLEKRQMPIYQRTDEIHENTRELNFKLAY